MALESIAPLTTPSIAAPTTTQPVISPQAPTGGVPTIGTSADSVVVSLSESLAPTERRDQPGAEQPDYFEVRDSEQPVLSQEKLDNILAPNLSVRLSYDNRHARNYIEIYNVTTNHIVLRSPSEHFVDIVARQLQTQS